MAMIDLLKELKKIRGVTAAAIVDLRTGFSVGQGGTMFEEEPGVYPRKDICIDADKLALLFRHLDAEDDFVRIQLGDAFLSALCHEQALVVVARSCFDGFATRQDIELQLTHDPDQWIKHAQEDVVQEIGEHAEKHGGSKGSLLRAFLTSGILGMLEAAAADRAKPEGDHC